MSSSDICYCSDTPCDVPSSVVAAVAWIAGGEASAGAGGDEGLLAGAAAGV